MNLEPIVTVKDLSIEFNRKQIVKNINLKLYPNRINVFIGASGSGKTTFLRSLNRLNEELGAKTSGRVIIKFKNKKIDIYNLKTDVSLLRRKIGMVFQVPNLLPGSIADNILLPLKLLFPYDKETRERQLLDSLKKVHLLEEVKDRLHMEASILSGGQQQRLCLARTLALKPEILLLDEPTASLDFQSSKRIEELILELKQNYTLLVVSHSLSQARRLADCLFLFKEGKIVAEYQDKKAIESGFAELLEMF
ncbi:MAG: phosphate transport system ATP-binding protein [Desulfonauticus sp.]|jgi:phosphate transport system ATP-binding protein|nr:phosphate transport system ATP-binding protein [Desulfonauticus sp.]